MLTKGREADSTLRLARFAISCLLVVFTLCTDLPLLSENVHQEPQPSSSSHHLIVLLDVNTNQRRVLAVELSLAEGVIKKLDQPGNVFSVITFGSQPPALLKSGVNADEAVAATGDVSLEPTSADYLSAHLYDALNLAFGQFINDAGPKSLLIIAEGNDRRGKSFKQAVFRAKQLHVGCNVAMVADHTFYGSKAIQRYGFYLRQLAAKTRARYIEVGGQEKEVPRSINRFSESILGQL